MAASSPRDRRPAIWPWLVMPLIVAAVFWLLKDLHRRPGPPVENPTPAAATPPAPGQ
ncbi:MAG: hypothetical protein JSR36_13625 [Proteobacteria bacterium]|nr:hypothetical protein [Pseudomonadota bacterium]